MVWTITNFVAGQDINGVTNAPPIDWPVFNKSNAPTNQQYLTGVYPRTRDFGQLLEETLLWFAMARSGVFIGAPHITFTKPFECNEIDILLYGCAGKTKQQKDDPAEGWQAYLGD